MKLAIWVGDQRHKGNNGKLSKDKIRKLDGIGFDWDPNESTWQEMYSKLIEFSKTNGHSRVPIDYPEDSSLAVWCSRQRGEFKFGRLSKEKQEKLEKLPKWAWDINEAYWNEGLEHLKEFFQEHGHAKVPFKYVSKDGCRLGNWRIVQCRNYQDGTLLTERQREIESFQRWEWSY